MSKEVKSAEVDSRIKCEVCGAMVHSIQHHLKADHSAEGTAIVTLEEYQAKWPEAPLMSQLAIQKIAEQRKAREAASVSADSAVGFATELQPFHEVFSLGRGAATMGASGNPIPVTVIKSLDPAFQELVPDVDPNYVFNIDVLKTLLMGLELRIPVYLWGHAGTGKTTIYEQIAARTGRPMLRVQHTANMEEEHVIGGWRLRDGRTVFELGPLSMAMKFGWTYLADEYDFGRPEVLSVYQSVLEGKPLIIKEADSENRIIRPHPNFRFIATGNTNGQGDETGLYQGTSMQNAANYERFGIVEKMPYMEPAVEAALVSKQAKISVADAKKLVDFANRIRGEFESSKLSNPISPRSLIFAGRIGIARLNYLIGLEKAYLNRLTSIDREAATQLANRVFGS